MEGKKRRKKKTFSWDEQHLKTLLVVCNHSPWCCLHPRSWALGRSSWRRWRWWPESRSGASRTGRAPLSFPANRRGMCVNLPRAITRRTVVDSVSARWRHSRGSLPSGAANLPHPSSSTSASPWCSPLERGRCWSRTSSACSSSSISSCRCRKDTQPLGVWQSLHATPQSQANRKASRRKHEDFAADFPLREEKHLSHWGCCCCCYFFFYTRAEKSVTQTLHERLGLQREMCTRPNHLQVRQKSEGV